MISANQTIATVLAALAGALAHTAYALDIPTCESGGYFYSKPNCAPFVGEGRQTYNVIDRNGELCPGIAPSDIKCSKKEWNCEEGASICNPFIYGVKANDGEVAGPICVSITSKSGQAYSEQVGPICRQIFNGTLYQNDGKDLIARPLKEDNVVGSALAKARLEKNIKNRLAFRGANSEAYRKGYVARYNNACDEAKWAELNMDEAAKTKRQAGCAAIRRVLNEDGLLTATSANSGRCETAGTGLTATSMCYACSLEAAKRAKPENAGFVANRAWLTVLETVGRSCRIPTGVSFVTWDGSKTLDKMLSRYGYCSMRTQTESLALPTEKDRRDAINLASKGAVSSQDPLLAQVYGFNMPQLRKLLCGDVKQFDETYRELNSPAALDGVDEQKKNRMKALLACAHEGLNAQSGNESNFKQNCGFSKPRKLTDAATPWSGAYMVIDEDKDKSCVVELSRNGTDQLNYDEADFSRPINTSAVAKTAGSKWSRDGDGIAIECNGSGTAAPAAGAPHTGVN